MHKRSLHSWAMKDTKYIDSGYRFCAKMLANSQASRTMGEAPTKGYGSKRRPSNLFAVANSHYQQSS